jgi:integrase
MDAACRVVGFGTPGTETEDEKKAGVKLTNWPANALRHSYASYHLAHFKDAAALALEMGHTNSALVFEHYRELVKPKDAQRYWDIKPAAADNVLAMTA